MKARQNKMTIIVLSVLFKPLNTVDSKMLDSDKVAAGWYLIDRSPVHEVTSNTAGTFSFMPAARVHGTNRYREQIKLGFDQNSTHLYVDQIEPGSGQNGSSSSNDHGSNQVNPIPLSPEPRTITEDSLASVISTAALPEACTENRPGSSQANPSVVSTGVQTITEDSLPSIISTAALPEASMENPPGSSEANPTPLSPEPQTITEDSLPSIVSTTELPEACTENRPDSSEVNPTLVSPEPQTITEDSLPSIISNTELSEACTENLKVPESLISLGVTLDEYKEVIQLSKRNNLTREMVVKLLATWRANSLGYFKTQQLQFQPVEPTTSELLAEINALMTWSQRIINFQSQISDWITKAEFLSEDEFHLHLSQYPKNVPSYCALPIKRDGALLRTGTHTSIYVPSSKKSTYDKMIVLLGRMQLLDQKNEFILTYNPFGHLYNENRIEKLGVVKQILEKGIMYTYYQWIELKYGLFNIAWGMDRACEPELMALCNRGSGWHSIKYRYKEEILEFFSDEIDFSNLKPTPDELRCMWRLPYFNNYQSFYKNLPGYL